MAKKSEYNHLNSSNISSNARNSYVAHNNDLNSRNDVVSQHTYVPNNYEQKTRMDGIKKKSESLATTLKTFAILCSSVALGVVGVDVIAPPKISADIVELEAYDMGVYYVVNLSEYNDGVTIELHNDFTNRVNSVTTDMQDYADNSEDGGFEVYGYFENLAPNMQYTFAVKLGNKTIAKQTVVTRYDEEKYIDDYNDYVEDDTGQNIDDTGQNEYDTGETDVNDNEKPVSENGDNNDYGDIDPTTGEGSDGTGTDNGYYDESGNYTPGTTTGNDNG